MDDKCYTYAKQLQMRLLEKIRLCQEIHTENNLILLDFKIRIFRILFRLY